MAIRLGYAIGLGGKRESVIKDLGEGIGEIAKGLADAKKADAAQRLKAQQDAEAAMPDFDVPKGEMLKSDMDYITNYAKQSYIELNNDIAQGKSPSYIERKGIERKNEIARLANQAAQDYKISVELGTLKKEEKQNFYMDDADKKFLEHISKPISEREDASQFRAKVFDLLIPVKGSMVDAIKTTHSEFQPEKDFWMERTIEGTNKILPVDENQVKQRGFYIEQAMRDPDYMKNVGYRAMQMLKGVQFKDEEDAKEQMQLAKEKVVNSDYDDMVRESRPRDLKVNLPSQGKGLNINFGGGGVTINNQTTFVDQPNTPIDKEVQGKRKKLQEKYNREESYRRKLKANLNKPGVTPEYQKQVQNQIERSDARISRLMSDLNKSEKESVESYRNTHTLLNVMKKSGDERGKTFFDEKGGKIEGVSRVDNIVFDPETGVPVTLIGMQKEGDMENPITIPINPTNVGILNTIMGNTLLSHVKEHQKQNHLRPESVIALDNLLVRAQKLGSGSRAETNFASKGTEMQPDAKAKIKGGQYGSRPDGTQKDKGFLGELKTKSGKPVTEYSIGTTDVNGKQIDIPTLVPTINEEEKQYILEKAEKNEPIGKDAIGQSIYNKAVAHAKKRIKEGKSVFYESKSVSLKGGDKKEARTKKTKGGITFKVR